jgi:hypothetical protein
MVSRYEEREPSTLAKDAMTRRALVLGSGGNAAMAWETPTTNVATKPQNRFAANSSR